MKARAPQVPGAVSEAAISAFLEQIDPNNTLQVKAAAGHPSVRHAVAVRGARDGDAAWLGLKVKTAAQSSDRGRLNFHITVAELRSYVADGFAVLLIGLDAASSSVAFVFHGPADLAGLARIEGSKSLFYNPFGIRRSELSDALSGFVFDLRGTEGRVAAWGRLSSGGGCTLAPLSQSCVWLRAGDQ